MNFYRFFQLSGLAFLCSVLFSFTDGPWEPIFKGEDLEGWTVKDACITCNSLGDKEHNYVWLATEREFTNFHLKHCFSTTYE